MGGVILPLLIMALLPLLTDDTTVLPYLRRNFVAWMPLFCIGIYMAKIDRGIWHYSVIPSFLIMLSSLVLSFLVHLNYYSWLLAPFFTLTFFLSLSKIIEVYYPLKVIFAKIGEYSTYIFLSHHLGVILCCNFCTEWHVALSIVTYVSVVAILTIIFNFFHNILVRKVGGV